VIRHTRRRHRRKRWWVWDLLALVGTLAVAFLVTWGPWGRKLAARIQLRVQQTVRDLPRESADVALAPICFLLALVIAVGLAILIYRLGRNRGFIVAGVNTAVVFLLWAWAFSSGRIPLHSIELHQVRLPDLLYALSFYTVVLVPLGSYFAWYRASLR
jgi:hypothetical protein